jgi:16S rRNA (cytosine967-C5)-methyltransferase
MLDLPCSALGVIRRNPEVKWRRKANDLLRFAEKQRLILRALSPLLKPGGTLLYSTCSTTTTENEDIVNEFLSHHKDFVVEDLRQLFPSWSNLFTSDGFFRSWPHKTEAMDGFFAARIRKIR